MFLVLASACTTQSDGDGMDAAGTETTAETTAEATAETTGSASSEGAADSSGGVGDGSDDASDGSGDTGEAGGEALYAQLCVSCHGPTAEGTALGYELRHPSRAYAEWVIRNGRTGTELAPSVMGAYAPSLVSDADLESMFDYLDSFPQPTDGEGLYADYCANCHGADALGGEVGKNIRREIGEALNIVRSGNGGTDYGDRGGYMPSWNAEALSDAEVASIVTYVEGL